MTRMKRLRAHLDTVGAQVVFTMYPRSKCVAAYRCHRLPSQLMPAIDRIPKGKGLAGQAWLDGQPVVSCNLAADPLTGIKAKTLPFQSTYALPVYECGEIIAILGVAFTEAIQLDAIQQTQLSRLPESLRPMR